MKAGSRLAAAEGWLAAAEEAEHAARAEALSLRKAAAAEAMQLRAEVEAARSHPPTSLREDLTALRDRAAELEAATTGTRPRRSKRGGNEDEERKAGRSTPKANF